MNRAFTASAPAPARVLVGVLVLGGLLAASAASATSLLVGVQDRRLDIDASFAPETVENDQTSLRVTYTWDLGDAFTLVATGGGASSYLGLNDTRLNGATDLRLRGLYRIGDRFVVGAGSIVPMGLYELAANEVTAAQWVWNPRSGFPLSRFGEGWGWELTSAWSFPLGGDLSAAVAGAYLHHAEFDLLGDETGLYRLGNEVSVSGALDWRPADGSSLLLQAAYRSFGSDELGGEEFLEKGGQFSLGGSASLPLGAFVLSSAARLAVQADNSFAPAEGDTVAISEAAGTRYGLDLRVGRGVGEDGLVYLDALYAVVAGTDYAIPVDGSAFSVGPGFGWRMGDPISLGARLLWVDSSGDDDLSYTGTDLLITLEYRP